jgi:hypothetical protein
MLHNARVDESMHARERFRTAHHGDRAAPVFDGFNASFPPKASGARPEPRGRG